MMKVSIELRPYDALGILAFLRENFNSTNKNVKQFATMHESIKAYEKQIFEKITGDMISEAETECAINELCHRQPK